MNFPRLKPLVEASDQAPETIDTMFQKPKQPVMDSIHTLYHIDTPDPPKKDPMYYHERLRHISFLRRKLIAKQGIIPPKIKEERFPKLSISESFENTMEKQGQKCTRV